jgi:hypothetical protein
MISSNALSIWRSMSKILCSGFQVLTIPLVDRLSAIAPGTILLASRLDDTPLPSRREAGDLGSLIVASTTPPIGNAVKHTKTARREPSGTETQ